MESESWIVAAIGAVGVALATVIPWVIKFFSSRSESSRTQRADTIREWGEYADRQEQRIIILDRRIEELTERYDKKILDLMMRYDAKLAEQEVRRAAEVKALTDRQTLCVQENAEQRGEIKLLQATVARLQMVTGDQLTGSSMPGLVVADLKGIIKEASPAMTAILHWPIKELVGQSVERLIPKRFLEKHREGMRAIVTSGKPPWPERVLLTYALTKQGDEVPVRIRLYGWQVGTTDWLISAEIQRRLSTGDSSVIKKTDLSEALSEEARRGEGE